MDIFSVSQPENLGFSIFALNVQSPPLKRAKLLVDEIIKKNAEVLVLSELSHGEGSIYLVDSLKHFAGYECYFDAPEKGNYSVAICVKNCKAKETQIFNDSRIRGIKVITNHEHKRELIIIGVYAPSLNEKNREKRLTFFRNLWKYFKSLSSKDISSVILIGDVNSISPNHYPKYSGFTKEGFPLYLTTEKFELIDLFQSNADQIYTWNSPDRRVFQLLDNCYVAKPLRTEINDFYVLDSFRKEKLSDHSAIVVQGFD